jgi:hypothetical protein
MAMSNHHMQLHFLVIKPITNDHAMYARCQLDEKFVLVTQSTFWLGAMHIMFFAIVCNNHMWHLQLKLNYKTNC